MAPPSTRPPQQVELATSQKAPELHDDEAAVQLVWHAVGPQRYGAQLVAVQWPSPSQRVGLVWVPSTQVTEPQAVPASA